MRCRLVILSVHQWFILCACYQDRDRCPFQSQWKTRADWFCNGGSVGKYTCLLNGIQNKYEESCSYDHNVLDAGEQYIISHNLHGVKCRNEDKFQPFPLRSNASSECILKKSKCSDPGQVLFNNGSTKEDRSCRCDFENGFAFLSTPNHPCKCVPSQEDCSCFKKECPFEFKLTPDYICVHQKNRSYKSVCPDLGPRSEVVLLPAKRNTEYSVRRVKPDRTLAYIILVVIAIYGTFILLLVVEKVPFLYIKIRLEAPSIFRAAGDNGKIRLEWTKPEETKFKIDKFMLEESIDSWTTTISKLLPADKLEYEVEKVQQLVTYRWKLYSCSNNFRSRPIDEMFSTKHGYQFGMTLKGERAPNTRQKEEGIQLAFQTTSKDIPGNQELVDTQIRIGSIIVVLTFTTEGFYDETVIRNKFENAAKSGVFGDMTDSDTNFWFKPLNNPQPPLSVKSTNANNVVTVSWKDPKRTFFRTEHFIIQSTIDNWKTVEEHQVPSNDNSFSIKDVPPTIIIRFKIYTGICNSIRSLPSDEVFTHVIGPTPPNNIKAVIEGKTIEISWSKPLHPIMKFVDHYKLSIEENGKIITEEVGSDEELFVFQSYKPSTIYKFKVSTYTTNNIESDPTTTVEIKTEKSVVNDGNTFGLLSNGRESTNNKHESAQVQVGKGRESFMKNKEYENAQVQVEKDGFSTSSFCISDNLAVHEVKLLHSERLIFSERYEKRLLTCTLDEKQMQTITVKGYPCNITTIDELNVAVSLKRHNKMLEYMYFEIAIVDVQKLYVIRTIAEFPCFTNMYCCPITFANNKLFVNACFGEIETMDISGRIRKKIDLSSKSIAFSCLSYRKLSNEICGISVDRKNIISVEYDGSCNTLYNFSEKGILEKQLAVDNEDNFLVFTSDTYKPDYKVHTISPDGNYQRELLSAKLHPHEHDEPTQQHYASCFCVQNSLRTIVIVKGNVVYLYRYIQRDNAT